MIRNVRDKEIFLQLSFVHAHDPWKKIELIKKIII